MNQLRLASLLIGFVTLATLTAAPRSAPARTLLDAGSATVWKYLDSGPAPDASWRTAGFDDARWKSGSAPLGYGEPRLGTEIAFGDDAAHKRPTAWFRREFAVPRLESGERLAILLCVDDGAVVYLNGQEVGRVNMPAGEPRPETLAAKTVGNPDEGFYQRLLPPVAVVRAGQQNLLAVEVHQASAMSSDLFFDAAIKLLPASPPAPAVSAAAQEVVRLYNQQHFVGPGVRIPDGYLDGGRRMKIDDDHHASSGREILWVDREHDKELAADLAFARSPELRALPPLERIQRIAARIDRETTPPGGMRWVGETTTQLEDEFTNRPLLIGDWVDQCAAGVCRHRSLLFKILADEAGLKAALVRGNYVVQRGPPAAHAWNEVTLDDGRRLLVDVMHHGGRAIFPEVTDPDVVKHYLKVDNTPWYRP